MVLHNHSRKSKNVLLVEDNLLNQRVAQIMLQDMGHRLDVAASGQEALNFFEHKRYDIVFMDIGLPDMDGTTVARKMRMREQERHAKHTPIVAMTAYVRDEDKRNCLQAGMDNFIGKPIMINHLMDTMEAVK